MAMYRTCVTLVLAVLAFVTTISAQTVVSSNNTSEIPPYDSSPRFWINGTGIPGFRVAPLGWYARIQQSDFQLAYIVGTLRYIDVNNANTYYTNTVDYISCDPDDYPGVLQAADVLRLAASSQQGNSIVLYSTRADHCNTSSLREIAPANGIFTTLDPSSAQAVLTVLRNHTNGMPVAISPDRSSFTNSNGNQPGYGPATNSTNSPPPKPTTAVAMIILYTITGLITALFVVIIVTGAVRAHRHPERYGANIAGRPRRSRAKGIARAMLDTIPIVKFGEKDENAAAAAKEVDIEMVAAKTADSPDKTKSATVEVAETDKEAKADGVAPTNVANPDGTDEAGQLGCSICTEDFNKGEEVRVLPCNHKFHPECVDPWLLNVSGTCPLCRIDLRPKGEQDGTAENGEPAAAPTSTRRSSMFDLIAPPLGHPSLMRPDRVNLASRRDTVSNLQSAASGSREDRIAALRRYRQQRRNRGEQPETAEQAEERRSISTRLRERFRVRTRRQGEEEAVPTEGESSSSRSNNR